MAKPSLASALRTAHPSAQDAVLEQILEFASTEELESARAYYEEAIASIKRIRQPSYERWFTAALGRMSGVPPPDVSHTRIQFLKGRLHDLEFGRAPEGEYRGEMGGRWTSLARRSVRSSSRS